jgi:hypothetical protein
MAGTRGPHRLYHMDPSVNRGRFRFIEGGFCNRHSEFQLHPPEQRMPRIRGRVDCGKFDHDVSKVRSPKLIVGAAGRMSKISCPSNGWAAPEVP